MILTPDEARVLQVLEEIASHVRYLLETYPDEFPELRELIDSLDLAML